MKGCPQVPVSHLHPPHCGRSPISSSSGPEQGQCPGTSRHWVSACLRPVVPIRLSLSPAGAVLRPAQPAMPHRRLLGPRGCDKQKLPWTGRVLPGWREIKLSWVWEGLGAFSKQPINVPVFCGLVLDPPPQTDPFPRSSGVLCPLSLIHI